MEKDAIQYVEQGSALTKAQEAVANGDQFVLVPEEVKVLDLEKFMGGPRRRRGHFQTSSIPDFGEYVGAEDADTEGAPEIYVDPEDFKAVAYMNPGGNGFPGHMDHTAGLKLEKTPQFEAFLQINGQEMSQRRLQDFIADWAPWLGFYDEDGEEMTHSKALSEIRSVTITAEAEQNHTESNRAASRSKLESFAAASSQWPEHMEFEGEAVDGLDNITIRARLGLRMTGDRPVVVPRIIGLEAEEKRMAVEFAQTIREQLDGSCTVLIGRYSTR